MMQDFLDEMRSHKELADLAICLEGWHQEAKRGALHNKSERQFISVVEWIAARTDHSLIERLAALSRLSERLSEGPIVGSIALLTGLK
jgi:hypothetical protein